jgi:hypothetical protein
MLTKLATLRTDSSIPGSAVSRGLTGFSTASVVGGGVGAMPGGDAGFAFFVVDTLARAFLSGGSDWLSVPSLPDAAAGWGVL